MKHALTLALALATTCAFAQYTPIEYNPSTMVATAQHWEGGRVPQNAINTTPGFGIDANGNTGYNLYDYDYSWTSDNVGNPMSAPVWYRVDLGETFNLGALRLWNYKLPWWGDYTGRSVRHVDVFTSDSNDPAVIGATPDFDNPAWTLLLADYEFEKAPFGDDPDPQPGVFVPYTGEFVEFPLVKAQWVGLRIKSHYGRDHMTGFFKLQFSETSAPGVILNALAVEPDGEAVVFSGELILGDAQLPAHLVACSGQTNGGDDFGAWDIVKDYGDTPGGPFSLLFDNLDPDRGYYFSAAATNGVDTAAWSVPGTFITGVASVGAPADFYKFDSGLLVFTRPGTASNVPLTVTYTVDGTAQPGMHYVPLPGYVFFPEGVSVVQQPITAINTAFNGHKTVEVTLLGGNCLTNATSTCSFQILDNEAGGKETTWTGAHDNTSWGEPGNWTHGVPGLADTAIFGNAANNATIALGANRGVYKIKIDATVPFTLGDIHAAHTLMLVDIERTAGSSGPHEISAPVTIIASSATGVSTWDINGNDGEIDDASGLIFNAAGNNAITTLNAPIVKTGNGKLKLMCRNDGLADLFTCREGVVLLLVSNALYGGLYVGGGDTPAYVEIGDDFNYVYALANYATVTVATNGALVSRAYTHMYFGTLSNLFIEDNGRVDLWHWERPYIFFRGGEFRGNMMPAFRYVECQPHHTTAVLDSAGSGGMGFNNWWEPTNFLIEKGSAPIALRINGRMTSVLGGLWAYKAGAGTLQITGDNDLQHSVFAIAGGAVLFDNPVGTQGLGNTPVVVERGTLGGTGFIGGAERGDVTLSGNESVLAPGTIDETTGAHIIGTLTVGTVLTNNTVTLGDSSTLRVNLGPLATNDRLDVFGAVGISANDTTLEITTAGALKSGLYTLVSTTGGVNGEFANVLVDGVADTRNVRYTANEVQYLIPPRGTIFLLK